MLEDTLSSIQWNKMRSLNIFIFSRNKFLGVIPQSLGMTSMRLFVGSEAHLQGEIPHSFQNLSSLEFVDLQGNQLDGYISEALDALSDTHKGRIIKGLILSSNMFTGSIPPWIGSRFKGLHMLILAGNQLEGELPATISTFPALQQPTRPNIARVDFGVLLSYLDPITSIVLTNSRKEYYGLLVSFTVLIQ